MTSQPKIYHNPRCTKSRLTVQLLQDKGFIPKVVDYLKTGVSAKEVDTILTMLGKEPRAFLRTCEPAYTESGADNPALTRAELIGKIVEHPILFERPVVVYQGKAAIGRPPENVLSLFK